MSNNNFYKYNFLTNKAFEFQSEIMSGKTMTFTKVEIGDGIIKEDESLEEITSLKNKITDVKILSVIPNGHTVELTVLLDGEGLERVTLYREIGIYAEIDGEEALYAYLNSDERFDYIIPLNEGSQKEFTSNKIKITLVVGNADNINVTLNNVVIPDNSITLDMLNVEVKNFINNTYTSLNSKITTHLQENMLSENGTHGLRYNEFEKRFEKKNNDLHWIPLETNSSDIEILKYMMSEKISDNLFSMEKEDIILEGGCYDYVNKKYFININNFKEGL